MKKFAAVVIVLIVAMFLASCDRNGTVEPMHTIEDFFPRIPDRHTHFEGTHTETRLDADGHPIVRERELHLVFFEDYIHETLSQRRAFQWVDGNEQVAVEVFKKGSGNLYNINGIRGLYARTDFTGAETNMEVVILSEPLVVGHEWVRADLGHTFQTAKVISMDTEIEVPYGTFSTMVVEVKSADGARTLEYYAVGYGLVKLEMETETVFQYHHLTEVIYGPFVERIEIFVGWHFETEEFEDGFVREIPVPDVHFVSVEYHTNADIPSLYMEVLRQYMSETWGIEPDPAIAFNFIDHDRHNMLLHLDLTPEFVPFMEGFGAREFEILQLFADTMGFRYDAYAVTISVNGEAYRTENLTIDPAAGDFIVMTMYRDFAQDRE